MNETPDPATPAGRKRFRVAISGVINAPAGDIYDIIADYKRGHPRIVPPRYFRNLKVIGGGYGDGTMIEFDMVAFGATQRVFSCYLGRVFRAELERLTHVMKEEHSASA